MSSDDEELFRRLEVELFAAHEGVPDLGAIARLYADDFFSTNADGRVVNKAQWIDMLRTGRFAVDRIAASDFKVRRFGVVAVVTGRSRYVREGHPIWDVRHTQVWAQIDGRTFEVMKGPAVTFEGVMKHMADNFTSNELLQKVDKSMFPETAADSASNAALRDTTRDFLTKRLDKILPPYFAQ